MPQYRLTLLDKEGKQHVRVLTATDHEAAARAAIGGTGWKCISCDLDTGDPALHANSTQSAAGSQRRVVHKYLERSKRHPVMDFFDFRIMISPVLVRAIFVLCTVALASLMLYSPVLYMQEYSRLNVAREQRIDAIKQERQRADDALAKLPALEAAVLQARTERDKYVNEPNHRMVFREAEAKFRQAEALVTRLLQPMHVRNAEELKEYRANCDTELAAVSPTQLPSFIPMATSIGGGLLIWIGLRLALELYCILFAIHERLSEIRDQRVRG